MLLDRSGTPAGRDNSLPVEPGSDDSTRPTTTMTETAMKGVVFTEFLDLSLGTWLRMILLVLVLTLLWALPTHYAARMLVNSDPRAPANGSPCLRGAAICLPRLLGLLTFLAVEVAIWRSYKNIPTLDEQGLPGLAMPYWTGLWVKKGTPAEIVARLNAAVVEAMADPAIAKRLTDLGQQIPPGDQQTPQALVVLHRATIEKWWPIIKAAGIKAE